MDEVRRRPSLETGAGLVWYVGEHSMKKAMPNIPLIAFPFSDRPKNPISDSTSSTHA
jgi:hypothetical protein